MPTVAVTLYLTDQPPPDDLATSIRCVVLDGGRVLVCKTPHDQHIIPGGRRELGESWEETARREVYEETGFEVDALSLLGVVLLHQDGERPDDPSHTYPHPDCFWVVYRAQARSAPLKAWADTEGWETGSELYDIADALQLDLSAVDSALLRATAPGQRSPSDIR